ncbi:MAG TPA: hypothetical protein VIW80_20205 [Pyrinomonadaceae bacterium]
MKINTIRVLGALCLVLAVMPSVLAQRRGTQRRSQPSAASATGDYFPLRVGDSWTYRHSEGSKFTYKVLSEEKQADGTMRYLVELVSGSRVHYLYSKPKGWVLQHRISYPDEQTGLKVDYEPGRKHLQNPLIPGSKWSWNGKDVGGNDVSESNEVIGPEWVEVPAGKFRAIKIISHVSNGGTVATRTNWYADGIGVVKSWTDAGAIKYGFELEDYSFKKTASR